MRVKNNSPVDCKFLSAVLGLFHVLRYIFLADKITKPRGQIQTYSSDNLNVNVGILFRGKLYDNLTLLNTQAMVKLMLQEGKFNNNYFLIG